MDETGRQDGRRDGRGRRRTRTALVAGGTAVAVLVAGGLLATTGVSAAADPAHPGGVEVTPLGRGVFPDEIRARFEIRQDGEKRRVRVRDMAGTVVASVRFEPGGSLGWHTHPGPAVATVTQGALTLVNADDCVERVYAAGEAFMDQGQGNVHVGFNASGEETVVQVVFLDVPAGEAPTVHAEAPEDCEL